MLTALTWDTSLMVLELEALPHGNHPEGGAGGEKARKEKSNSRPVSEITLASWHTGIHLKTNAKNTRTLKKIFKEQLYDT